MNIYEDIEKDYTKRKKEAEDRANQILYGKNPEPSEPEISKVKEPEIDSINFLSPDKNGELKFEERKVVEPLEFQKSGTKIYRYVGELDPLPEPPPKKYGPQRPKGFLAHERSQFMIQARKDGLTTMNDNGIIEKPDGTKVVGIFRRA